MIRLFRSFKARRRSTRAVVLSSRPSISRTTSRSSRTLSRSASRSSVTTIRDRRESGFARLVTFLNLHRHHLSRSATRRPGELELRDSSAKLYQSRWYAQNLRDVEFRAGGEPSTPTSPLSPSSDAHIHASHALHVPGVISRFHGIQNVPVPTWPEGELVPRWWEADTSFPSLEEHDNLGPKPQLAHSDLDRNTYARNLGRWAIAHGAVVPNTFRHPEVCNLYANPDSYYTAVGHWYHAQDVYARLRDEMEDAIAEHRVAEPSGSITAANSPHLPEGSTSPWYVDFDLSPTASDAGPEPEEDSFLRFPNHEEAWKQALGSWVYNTCYDTVPQVLREETFLAIYADEKSYFAALGKWYLEDKAQARRHLRRVRKAVRVFQNTKDVHNWDEGTPEPKWWERTAIPWPSEHNRDIPPPSPDQYGDCGTVEYALAVGQWALAALEDLPEEFRHCEVYSLCANPTDYFTGIGFWVHRHRLEAPTEPSVLQPRASPGRVRKKTRPTQADAARGPRPSIPFPVGAAEDARENGSVRPRTSSPASSVGVSSQPGLLNICTPPTSVHSFAAPSTPTLAPAPDDFRWGQYSPGVEDALFAIVCMKQLHKWERGTHIEEWWTTTELPKPQERNTPPHLNGFKNHVAFANALGRWALATPHVVPDDLRSSEVYRVCANVDDYMTGVGFWVHWDLVRRVTERQSTSRTSSPYQHSGTATPVELYGASISGSSRPRAAKKRRPAPRRRAPNAGTRQPAHRAPSPKPKPAHAFIKGMFGGIFGGRGKPAPNPTALAPTPPDVDSASSRNGNANRTAHHDCQEGATDADDDARVVTERMEARERADASCGPVTSSMVQVTANDHAKRASRRGWSCSESSSSSTSECLHFGPAPTAPPDDSLLLAGICTPDTSTAGTPPNCDTSSRASSVVSRSTSPSSSSPTKEESSELHEVDDSGPCEYAEAPDAEAIGDPHGTQTGPPCMVAEEFQMIYGMPYNARMIWQGKIHGLDDLNVRIQVVQAINIGIMSRTQLRPWPRQWAALHEKIKYSFYRVIPTRPVLRVHSQEDWTKLEGEEKGEFAVHFHLVRQRRHEKSIEMIDAAADFWHPRHRDAVLSSEERAARDDRILATPLTVLARLDDDKWSAMSDADLACIERLDARQAYGKEMAAQWERQRAATAQIEVACALPVGSPEWVEALVALPMDPFPVFVGYDGPGPYGPYGDQRIPYEDNVKALDRIKEALSTNTAKEKARRRGEPPAPPPTAWDWRYCKISYIPGADKLTKHTLTDPGWGSAEPTRPLEAHFAILERMCTTESGEPYDPVWLS